jgi:hypothetical protein
MKFINLLFTTFLDMLPINYNTQKLTQLGETTQACYWPHGKRHLKYKDSGSTPTIWQIINIWQLQKIYTKKLIKLVLRYTFLLRKLGRLPRSSIMTHTHIKKMLLEFQTPIVGGSSLISSKWQTTAIHLLFTTLLDMLPINYNTPNLTQ